MGSKFCKFNIWNKRKALVVLPGVFSCHGSEVLGWIQYQWAHALLFRIQKWKTITSIALITAECSQHQTAVILVLYLLAFCPSYSGISSWSVNICLCCYKMHFKWSSFWVLNWCYLVSVRKICLSKIILNKGEKSVFLNRWICYTSGSIYWLQYYCCFHLHSLGDHYLLLITIPLCSS